MLCLRMALLAGLLFICPQLAADSQAGMAYRGWFLKPYGGLSQLSDTDGQRRDVISQPVDISVDGGFVSGLGLGYRYNPQWAAELAWEYRTNDSETVYQDGTTFDDGNYASNTFYLNGYYYFNSQGKWQPYVGAGIGWVQEIDIDLEGNGPEQSFSGDGDFAYQVMLGAEYRWSEKWLFNGEIRYSKLSDIDLDAESGGASGAIEGLDYDPLSLTFGLTYRF